MSLEDLLVTYKNTLPITYSESTTTEELLPVDKYRSRIEEFRNNRSLARANLNNSQQSTSTNNSQWSYSGSSIPTNTSSVTTVTSSDGSVDKVLDRIVGAHYNTHAGYKDKVKAVINTIPHLDPTKKLFINDRIASYKKYGCDDTTALVYAALDGLESGYGKSVTGKNNIGGIKNGNNGYQNYETLDDYTTYKINLIETQYAKYNKLDNQNGKSNS